MEMKIALVSGGLVVGISLFMLIVMPVKAWAGCTHTACVHLKGIDSASVNVTVSRSSESAGIYKTLLSGYVLGLLRTKIPKLKINTFSLSTLEVYVSALDVNLGGKKYGVAYQAEVILESYYKKENNVAPARLWRKQILVISATHNLQRRLKETFDNFFTAFAADWYRVNSGN
jgi:hypothetical protein